MHQIEVTILKWEKYQFRKDIKNPRWFATSNELWNNSEFSLFNSAEKVVWYALLAIASRNQKAQIKFELNWLAQNAGVDKAFVLSSIEKASDNKWLTITRTESVQNPYRIRTLHIHNNNKTIHNNNNTKNIITKGTDSLSQMPKVKVSKVDNSQVIATYCSSYKARYNARPEIDGKTMGLVNGLLKTHSSEKLCDLLQVYLQMNDKWFVTKCHDFATFKENLTKISTAMQTGVDIGAPPKKKTWQELADEREAEEKRMKENGEIPI